MSDYKIVRFFQSRTKDNCIIKEGLTLKQAKEHCSDPETSSSSCSQQHLIDLTKEHGDWFDGYRSDGQIKKGIPWWIRRKNQRKINE